MTLISRARTESGRAQRLLTGVAVAAVVLTLSAGVARAQTPAGAKTSASSSSPSAASKLEVGVFGGVQSVQNLGGLFGGQVSYALSRRLSVVGEVGVAENVATRARIDSAQTLATYLQTLEGATAIGTLKAPATLFEGGVRVAVTQSATWPIFVEVLGGGARVVLQPTFTLGGVDVTTSLAQYGITLGSDLTGVSFRPAVTALVGASHRVGVWTVDVGAGLTTIQTVGQSANVLRVQVGFARSF